ncbi:MAG TPA: FIST N-terminal domain-containing protein [Kribbellaceae bacterium]|jgi:small ligand-binding sensory domain FIST
MARFGDGLAVGDDLVAAAEAAVGRAMAALGGRAPDLLCVFVSSEDPEMVAKAGSRAMELAGAGTAVGCSAGGVIADGHGVEATSAVAVWVAELPEVRLQGFRLTAARGGGGLLIGGVPRRRPDDRVGVLLADAHSFPISPFVEQSTDVLDGLPLVGGLASGLGGPGSTRLFVDGRVVDGGAVGVLLGGPVAVRTLVSQGCRPIGPTMTVTRSDGNVLRELAGMNAYRKLEEIVRALPPDEQTLAMHGLHIGISIDEYAEEHEQGDFLIRAVLGADPRSGAVAVGSPIEVGQTVRFQVGDAAAAHEDLRQLVARFRADGPVDGALLFSCNGRGAGLFPQADHDVLAVREGLGITGVAGFFAAGEIGPVAGRNHLHGFTASVLAFDRGSG